jgi:threonine dehydratase
MAEIPSLDSIIQAREKIAGSAIRTPLVRFQVQGAPAEIYLKLENLQPIGAFKIRGAANAIANIPAQELKRGVLTASAGNMGQGVAWKAREMGISCTVVAPETAPQAKLTALERLGARIIKVSFEEWWQTFERRSFPGVDAVYIHAFDDLNVMAGNGTIGLEILEDLPDVDSVVVPWGGGGLTCGIASAIQARRPECKVYAAEVATAAPLAASLVRGEPVTIEHQPSFVDGIGGKAVFPDMFDRARQLIEASLVATITEVRAALRLIAERNHVIAEGAGACAVAAALIGKAGFGKVVCIVSGGNIDLEKLRDILAE